MKDYLSVDIGGTNVKFAKLNNAGEIIDKSKIETAQEKEEFLSKMDEVVEKYVKQGVKGIAFCAPGKIAKIMIHFGGALPFLDGVDFAQRYAKYNLPVAVINDGKASVLAENWLGSLKDKQNCAAITLGTGVGGGIIVNGRLLNGVHYQVGELSFMQINMNATGFNGFAGGAASAVEMIKSVNKELGKKDETDGLAAFEAINSGDAKSMPIFRDFCKKVATVIINVQSVADLDAYAIGGGISAQPIVVEEINHAYDEIINRNPLIGKTLTKPQILDAKFKNSANLYGALYNLLLHVNGEEL